MLRISCPYLLKIYHFYMCRRTSNCQYLHILVQNLSEKAILLDVSLQEYQPSSTSILNKWWERVYKYSKSIDHQWDISDMFLALFPSLPYGIKFQSPAVFNNTLLATFTLPLSCSVFLFIFPTCSNKLFSCEYSD